jgi:hypothetical protein
MARIFQISLTGKVGPQKNFIVTAENMSQAINLVHSQVKPPGQTAKVHSYGPWEMRLARFVGFTSEMLVDEGGEPEVLPIATEPTDSISLAVEDEEDGQ